MRIYIAGPINSDAVGYIKNVSKMLKIAAQIRRLGHSVFVPCMDFLLGIMDGEMDYDDYFSNNIAWLEVSDALFFIGPSHGASKELEYAKRLGKRIFYSIDEIPSAASEADMCYYDFVGSWEVVLG